MRSWDTARRIKVSLLVILVVAATTAGGLGTALDEVGRNAINVTGRNLSGPSLARSAVDGQSEPSADELLELSAAGVADPLRVSNADPQAGDAELAAAAEQSLSVAEDSAIDPETQPEATPVAPVVSDSSSDDRAAATPVEPAPRSTIAPTTTRPRVTTTTTRPTTTTRRPQTTTTRPRATTTTAPPTTAAPATPGVVQVSGGVANGGGFSNTPINDAIASAKAGPRFEFSGGNHPPIKVFGAQGSQGNPIVITAADPGNRPTFIDNSYSGRAGIQFSDSSNVTISNVNVRKSMWGVRLEASSAILVDSVSVDDIGQEGIRVVNRSSYVTIQNSTVKNTGRRTGTAPDGQSYSLFGEGIYLGTGRGDSGDEVHHVTIRNNEISHTNTEAIDIKDPVRDVEISNNHIHDIRTGTSGAVVVHITTDYSAANPNIRITNNTISNITTDSGHRDGVAIAVGSSVDIIGNTISNTQHYSIRVEDGGPDGGRIKVNIRDNQFSNVGNASLWQSDAKATVNASNNSGF